MSEATKIIAIAAMTIDGRIARHSGQFTDWTSKEDKDVLHEHLDSSDVIVVGNNTFKTALEPLSKRNCIVFTRSVTAPERQGDRLLLFNPQYESIRAILSNYRTVALLGGTEVYTYFLRLGLIDELFLTIEPLVFAEGLLLFDKPRGVQLDFTLASVKQLNSKGSLLLHYKQ